jgi:hypothetical protein
LGPAESSGASPSHHAVRGTIARPHAVPCFCHALTLTDTVHAKIPRSGDMMIVIYWNIKRIVLGVKTTLCEMKA